MIKDVKPKLGVVAFVLPVYNAGKWLDKCLTSLSDQTYKDFVVVCVDDGSTDDCLSILEKWRQKDQRFIVLHQENKGQGSARNLALSYIETMNVDFVAFIDADDWVDSRFLEKLVNKSIREDADITACGFYRVDQNGEVWIDGGFPERDSLSRSDFIKLIFSRDGFKDTSVSGGMLWDKLFRHSILEGVNFVEDRSICEDELFIVEVLLRAKRFSLLKENLYFYNQIETSQIHSAGFMHKLLKGRMNCAELVFVNSRKDYISVASAFADSALAVLKAGDELEKSERVFLIRNFELIRNNKGLGKNALMKLGLYIDNPLSFRIYVMLHKASNSLKKMIN